MFSELRTQNFEPQTSNRAFLACLARDDPDGLGATVEGERLDRRVVTRAIDINGEVGAGG